MAHPQSRAGILGIAFGDAATAARLDEPPLLLNEEGNDAPADSELSRWLWWLPWLLLVVGVSRLLAGVKARRRVRGFSGGVVAVRDLRAGQAMVSGTAVVDEALLSPVTGTPCVYWEVSVTEPWEVVTYDVVEEVGPTVPGGSRQRASNVQTRSGATDHGTTRHGVAFQVDDGTGQVWVDPHAAEVIPAPTVHATVEPHEPAYHAIELREHPHSLGVRHVTEAVVRPGSPVAVLGPVHVDTTGTRISWTRRRLPGGRHPFRIMVDDPAWIQRAERRRMIRSFAIAAACLVGYLVLPALITA